MTPDFGLFWWLIEEHMNFGHSRYEGEKGRGGVGGGNS